MSEIFCTQKQCYNLDCIHHSIHASYDDPAIWADMSKDCEYEKNKSMIDEILEREAADMIQILNLPDKHRKHIVACSVLGVEGLTWWYYGSYDTEEKAYGVAEEIGGQVFYRPNYIISTIIDPTADMGMRTKIEEE